MLKIKTQELDYGWATGFIAIRGPERVGVTIRQRRRNGLSVKVRRRVLLTLQAWAVRSTQPRDRLSLIRRRGRPQRKSGIGEPS